MTFDEAWKDIPGFEGLYQISNYGRIKSFKVNKTGRIMKLTNANGDYFSVVLQGIGKKRRSTRIHRLVAEAFLPNPDGLPQINHIDGNKQNNRLDNLEWCSASENVKHSTMLHPEQLVPMCLYNQTVRPEPVLQLTKSGRVINRFQNAADPRSK